MNWFALVSSVVGRLPIENWLIKPRDTTKSLEELADRLRGAQVGNKPSISMSSAITTPANPPSNIDKAQAIATGCIPCAIGHYGTCSGLLNEAMRFAKKEGIESGEVIDRVNMCLDELNALERVDLRAELIVDLPDWEKELANKALTGSRNLRHSLESLSNVDDLERVTATTQTNRNEIGREWFRHRLERSENQ